jgi:hypothetical protein
VAQDSSQGDIEFRALITSRTPGVDLPMALASTIWDGFAPWIDALGWAAGRRQATCAFIVGRDDMSRFEMAIRLWSDRLGVRIALEVKS